MANKKLNKTGMAKIVSIEATQKKLYDVVKEHDANVIGSQIQTMREAHGLSLAAFANLLSQYGLTVGRQAIGKWETGNSVPNAYQLIAICHALNIEDGIAYFTREPKKERVLNEAGWRKVAAYKADLIASGLYSPIQTVVTTPIKYVTKKISELPVSAGTGAFLSDESFVEVRFPESAVPKGADFGIRVSGDSMEPVYHDGQIVWVHQCETLAPGEVGIFEYDGSGYLKVFDEQEPETDDEDVYTRSDGTRCKQAILVSYNEKYQPILVSPHAFFRIAGKVLN